MKTSTVSMLITLAILLISLQSCVPVLYSNVGHNVPLFHEKGEISLSAQYCSAINDDGAIWGESASGIGGQFAIAAGQSTAISSSFYSLKGDQDNGGNYFEIAIGKFKYDETKRLIGEIFMGTGFGSIENSLEEGDLNIKYVKPFVQPSGGFCTKNFELAFTPRIAFVSYTSKHSTLTDPTYQSNLIDFWSERKNTLVFEPGFTFRIGIKNIKAQFQYSISTFNYNWSDDSGSYTAVLRSFGSFGVFVRLSTRKSTS